MKKKKEPRPVTQLMVEGFWVDFVGPRLVMLDAIAEARSKNVWLSVQGGRLIDPHKISIIGDTRDTNNHNARYGPIDAYAITSHPLGNTHQNVES